jgi:hypothetical protein
MRNESPPADLAAAIAASPPAEAGDRLDKLREKVARVRELRLLAADLTEQLTAANREIQELTFKELPDVFAEAQMLAFTLEASGNLPAYEAEVKPYYKANIAADWPPDQRDSAFKLLADLGADGLIRTVITVELGRGEAAVARRVMAGLDKAGVSYTSALSVPWNTLTAWLREQVTKRGREFSAGQLEAIGARVGTVVDVKARKS